MQATSGFTSNSPVSVPRAIVAAGHVRACALLLLVAQLSLAGCGKPAASVEQQIEDLIKVVADAAEQQQAGDILALISPAYIDGHGNTHDDVSRLLRLQFLRQQDIVLLTTIDSVSVSAGTAAAAEVTVGMAGSDSSLLGFRADAYEFELEFETDGNPSSYSDWRLVSARWGELGTSLK
jgi:hypothetical protein